MDSVTRGKGVESELFTADVLKLHVTRETERLGLGQGLKAWCRFIPTLP